MRLGFEISDIRPENAGVNTYAIELLRHLDAVPDRPQIVLLQGFQKRDWNDVLLPRPSCSSLPPSAASERPTVRTQDQMPAAEKRVLRSTRHLAFKVIHRQPRFLSPLLTPKLRRHFDLVHWSNKYFLPVPGLASVVTVHDIIPIVHPDFVPAENTSYLRWRLRQIDRHASRVLTDSVHTRQDLMERVGIAEERIDVIPLAASETFRPPEDRVAQVEVLQRYGLRHGEYVLYVGTIEPRKNLVRLAQAFKVVIERHPDLETRLGLAGGRGWLTEEIDRGLAATNLGDRLLLPGRISDADLPALLNGARVVVYVSLYEGFGLPPLEAMASGAAVIASNTTSLPEVVGDGGLLVDPLDVDAIADAIDRVLTDDALHAELAQRGLQRASLFSWTRTAELTMNTYRKALATS